MCPECKLFLRMLLISVLCFYVVVAELDIPILFCLFVFLTPVAVSLGVRWMSAELVPLVAYVAVMSFITHNVFAVYFAIFTPVFLIASVRSGKRWVAVTTYAYACAMLFLAVLNASAIDGFLIVPTVITMLLNYQVMYYKQKEIPTIELFTDKQKQSDRNANVFMKGAVRENAKVGTGGDILVSASSDVKSLDIPKRKGCRAFILCEDKYVTTMQYMALWVHLLMRGYSVYGRVVYSQMIGEEQNEKNIFEAGGDYAVGFKCGLPANFTYISPTFFATLYSLNKKR